MPIFDLKTGDFSGEVVQLDHDIYNLPLRRDLVHNVYQYFEHKDKKIWKHAKTKGDVAGTGKKPAPQKGRGMARIGNRRAPHRSGGGVAHGPVPRDLSYPVNLKQRLQALKIMLSVKLYEDKLVFLEGTDLEFPKTQFLEAIVKPFGIDKLTFVTGQDPSDNNMQLAARNLVNVSVIQPRQVHVPSLLRSDYVLISKQGLIDLENIIEAREANYYRNRKVPSLAHQEIKKLKKMAPFEQEIIKPILESEHIEGYDDNVPLQLQTPTLKSYIDDLHQM